MRTVKGNQRRKRERKKERKKKERKKEREEGREKERMAGHLWLARGGADGLVIVK